MDDEPNLYIGNGWTSPFPSISNWLFGVPGPHEINIHRWLCERKEKYTPRSHDEVSNGSEPTKDMHHKILIGSWRDPYAMYITIPIESYK